MAGIQRSARVVWDGDLRSGRGVISTESGALSDIPYSFQTRFENEPGTNPEELIAAAHAACYSQALADTLANQGRRPRRIETQAACFLSAQRDGGFRITRMRLDVRAEVPSINEATFQEMIEKADAGCPVSNLLRTGLEIELHARGWCNQRHPPEHRLDERTGQRARRDRAAPS